MKKKKDYNQLCVKWHFLTRKITLFPKWEECEILTAAIMLAHLYFHLRLLFSKTIGC
jgi:hypothetical protein